MPHASYICPESRQALMATEDGLLCGDGKLYPFLRLPDWPGSPIVDFLNPSKRGQQAQVSLDMYDSAAAVAVYRNFLDWLFATFREDEARFRADLVGRLRLRGGERVLITGCGMGDDIAPVLSAVGPSGRIHAQDLSAAMVLNAAKVLHQERGADAEQVQFSVSDAATLPFADGAFDAALHFGGINLFDDVGTGLAEMARVVRVGGRVVVGDEGVGPWLRNTEYGRMVITNNSLWSVDVPIEKLPTTATDVQVSWVLGNCFWVIAYTVAEGFPAIDPHVPHKGWRGGTMWTRHLGRLEGVSPETRAKVIEAAAKSGLSVHDWLEGVLARQLQNTGDVE